MLQYGNGHDEIEGIVLEWQCMGICQDGGVLRLIINPDPFKPGVLANGPVDAVAAAKIKHQTVRRFCFGNMAENFPAQMKWYLKGGEVDLGWVIHLQWFDGKAAAGKQWRTQLKCQRIVFAALQSQVERARNAMGIFRLARDTFGAGVFNHQVIPAIAAYQNLSRFAG